MGSGKIVVLSSNTVPRISAPVNHSVYCKNNDYDYIFDATPYALGTPFDQKLIAIGRNLDRLDCDWLLWVDDDAYFMRLSDRLEQFVDVPDDVLMVICRSPVNPDGEWSAINSGLFFVRNCTAGKAIIKDALHADVATVKAWSDASRHGDAYRPGGDQLRLLYVMETQGLLEKNIIILPAEKFNARPYHFTERPDEQFICHFANNTDKLVELKKMQQRFGLDKYLLPKSTGTDPYRWSIYNQFGEGVKVERKTMMESIKGVVKTMIGRK